MIKIAPSVLTANFNNLQAELKSIETADYIHLDIMDGHFVPNLSFGPHIASRMSDVTTVPFDVHLMTQNPLDWIEGFSFKQTAYISIHVEANRVSETLKAIKNKGIKTGISLKPKTSIETLKPYLEDIDLVLVMSVEPGFGGQKFMEAALLKIKALHDLKIANNYHYDIEVDGGINDKTAALCIKQGATILVAGSYLFNQENRAKGIKDLKTCV